MFYEVDQHAQSIRYFSRGVLYSQIDWSNLDRIVDSYRQRIQDWYFGPAKELAKNWDFAFSVMALNCLLIDTLSQYVAGRESSRSNDFTEFIRKRLPRDYSCKLKTKIQHYDGREEKTLKDVASVLYYGFRCGILHLAHIPPYCGVAQEAKPVREVPGHVKYKKSGTCCPSIIVNPLTLLKDLEETFEAYLGNLKDRDQKNDHLRANFKEKFSSSFGE
ncbi:MAG TPA: hypothetical protein VH988_03685 [Thermoanaerobaculia bacterium]|jgi:hypothetical protein|nr:hypothetical protein [Thermoanaerobaculia bacterium]